MALDDLQNSCQVQLKTSLTTSEWNCMTMPNTKTSDSVLEISIFGDEDQSSTVGDLLSKAGFFLQAPRFQPDVPYRNPHMISFEDLSDNDFENSQADHDTSPNHMARSSSNPSKQDLSNVLDTLQQHEYLHPVEPDGCLTVDLFL